MTPPSTLRPGGFCWVDLAASDATAAQRFYAAAFGWTFRDQPVPGGHFTRCQFEGRDVASLYPLRAAQRAQGVPSHWTPYLAVDTLDAALQRVAAHGGRQIVAPLDVPGIARIALVEDAVGALVGLWQPIRASPAARG
jgi:predicted enzyme related to lactoylglutathione lyase